MQQFIRERIWINDPYGRYMLNTCSSSSPGLSGCISPFAKTEKLWFDARREAENQEYDIYKDAAEYFKNHDDGKLHVFIKADTPDEYYESLKKIRESANEYIVELPYAQDEEASLTEDEIIEL